MATNITIAQVTGNQKAYGIDDFRSMVNYERGCNRGYVRFKATSEGLKLEKVNKQLVSPPLSWLSNMSAAHNAAIRAKFLDAISKDLRYMDSDTVDNITNLIISPKKSNADRIELPAEEDDNQIQLNV